MFSTTRPSTGTRLGLAAVAACALAASAPPAVAQDAPISGFTADHTAHQRAYEAAFTGGTSAPPATPSTRRTPEDISVTMTAPYRRSLATRSAASRGRSASTRVVDGYNAYSPSGHVSGEVVYANYGLPEDYAAFEELGVNVAGKIVLVRYGRSLRRVKAQQAELRGAKGLIIYSDPADDRFTRGAVYPDGPWRPADAAAGAGGRGQPAADPHHADLVRGPSAARHRAKQVDRAPSFEAGSPGASTAVCSGTGDPATPVGDRLRLLPSGPDLVHEPTSRGTRPSTPTPAR